MRAWVLRLAAVAAAVAAAACTASAETVHVKYLGPVDLGPYRCANGLPSSFVWRICHRADQRQAIVSLGGTYYGYCGISRQAVDDWLAAGSLGQHYNAHIKGRFPCG